MKRSLAVTLLLVLSLILVGVPVGAQSLASISLTVYEDGYVLVNETIVTANYSVSLDVPLLGQHAEGLVALDENGNLLPAEVNGGNVTVYFGNATLIHLSYYTPDLTSKDGAIWTISLESPVPVEINLPPDAVVVDLSDIPLEIRGSSFLMPAGNVSVSYLIPIEVTTTTGSTTSSTEITTTTSQGETTTTTSSGGGSLTPSTSTTSQTGSPTTSSTSSPGSSSTTSSGGAGGSGSAKWIGLLLALLVIGGAAYLVLGKKKTPETRSESPESLERFREKINAMEGLNDDERGALLFLLENGGKAPQSKVREALGLPKTTAWRMFKRLEERGLVRVYKLGRENWVELVLE